MSNYFQVILFSLIGGVFSLIGGILLLSSKKTAQTLARIATPFAAGALLAAAFFEIIPEAMNEIPISNASLWILAGIVGFFLLEYFFHWFHHHHDHGKPGTPAPLIIIGDTLHNLLDGVAIGAAFLIDPATGIVAAIAIAAHEIPQEIGDFGLLLKFGIAKNKVILINVMSALAATVGALITFGLGSQSDIPTGPLLALTAGMFIYIAASDLIPLIHEDAKKKVGHLAAVLFLLGIVTIATTTTIAHQFIDHGHDHSHDHENENENADKHDESKESKSHEDTHSSEPHSDDDHSSDDHSHEDGHSH